MIKQGSKQAIRFFVMKTLKFSSVIENFFSDTLLLNSQFQDWYRGGSLFLSLLYILREVLLVSVPSVLKQIQKNMFQKLGCFRIFSH
ncbi:hypothetical protein ANCDUO_01093 [Ancylostoma duodenale]|uniref:Uncharacterized protein n=1 Tax=Ancylostoma duodenale TaxID=51022 RepID=A0A0C2DZT7_9BILA|nr:hypothetical protein ANCDUO_01093 [Ancylostoma duodenale]